MNRYFWLLATALVVLTVAGPLTAVSPCAAGDLMLGVAKIDITPEPGLRMWGYSNRTEGATGTLDPLHARAFVLKNGDSTVGIVTLDLGRTPEDPLLDGLCQRVAEPQHGEHGGARA